MKHDEEIVGEASRIEIEEATGRVFIVFEIKSEKWRNQIKKNWTEDLEFKLIDKNLISNE